MHTQRAARFNPHLGDRLPGAQRTTAQHCLMGRALNSEQDRSSLTYAHTQHHQLKTSPAQDTPTVIAHRYSVRVSAAQRVHRPATRQRPLAHQRNRGHRATETGIYTRIYPAGPEALHDAGSGTQSTHAPHVALSGGSLPVCDAHVPQPQQGMQVVLVIINYTHTN